MRYDDRPVVRMLEEFREQEPVSFHVPGHKHGALSGLPAGLRSALAYDVTELTGLDDLHEPAGAIRQAEQKLAGLYGSDRSFFLVNGSTVGNLAMLYAAAGRGDQVLVQRNAHQSVFHALELTGTQAVFLSPQWDDYTQTAVGVSAAEVKVALSANPGIRAAIFTYPTYYGMANEELGEIIGLCHEQGIPVLVDEAHGAHFLVSDQLPSSALALGADMVVQSAHKTLPAMTMASFLHVRSDLVDVQQIARYLHMLQSSSPSYLLMASLDDARNYVQTYKEDDYEELLSYRRALIGGLRGLPGMEVVETDDALKLLVRVMGHTGFAVQEALEEQSIYPELADLYQVLFVLPLLKAGHHGISESFVESMRKAVDSLGRIKTSAVKPVAQVPVSPVSAVDYPMDRIRSMKTEWIPIEEAAGRVACEAVVPYPPGIPLWSAGERITEGQCRQLKELLAAGARFQGGMDAERAAVQAVIE